MNMNGLYSIYNNKILKIFAQMIEHEINIFGIKNHWNNGNIFRVAPQ